MKDMNVDPSEIVERTEERTALMRALGALCPGQRLLVLLVIGQGVPLAVAAARVHIPPDAALEQLQCACCELRDRLGALSGKQR